MKQLILLAVFSFTGILASADDQTIPAPQPQYTIIKSRSSSCYRNDLWCQENLRNAAIADAQQASFNYCKTNFNNKSKVTDWYANCSAFFISENNPPVPPPPQPPDFPQSVTCQARFDFVCE